MRPARAYVMHIIEGVLMLDANNNKFIWMPYSLPDIALVIPPSAHIHSHLWCINVPLLNFQMVEWYDEDRVLCVQHIPDPPWSLGVEHEINKKGKHDKNWA
ncbi:hypothetical protein PVK06_012023 [Gossypium arboreum]|uniref:Uncharacterized protein n=1 Tax=Gossypium arboreum TaxID=29729 RepID=A0ABR0QAL9_GOSAR|nr:hypothetical protein PVK06_012023 [Gossypium arboreum]